MQILVNRISDSMIGLQFLFDRIQIGMNQHMIVSV